MQVSRILFNERSNHAHKLPLSISDTFLTVTCQEKWHRGVKIFRQRAWLALHLYTCNVIINRDTDKSQFHGTSSRRNEPHMHGRVCITPIEKYPSEKVSNNKMWFILNFVCVARVGDENVNEEDAASDRDNYNGI